jgi:uncharacterized protein YraI
MMQIVPRLVPLLSLLAALVLWALPSAAHAIDTGTPAWLVDGQVLREGPGHAYRLTGHLPDATRIQVDRCSYRWCKVHAYGQRGWVSRDDVNFGQHPRGPFTGPRLNYPSGGTVCFFEGHHYSGLGVCVPAGTVVHDLLLFGQDNIYSSVLIKGSGSVTACRDRNFTSYCERIIASQPKLDGFLDNALTSYRVH